MAKQKTKSASKKGKKASSGLKAAPTRAEKTAGGHLSRELWGILCLILALLVILSSFARSSAMARLFTGLTGQIGLYVLPIGLILCAIALMFHGNRPVTMRIICSLTFSFLISALAHLAIAESKASWDLEVFKTLYSEGIAGKSGGVIGGLLAMIFRLPGGAPVAWAICILLLVVTLPASLNLTLTSLLRAVNNHREELRKEQEQEAYREPAEVLVERVVQHRQNREVRRQNRNRYEYDLPVDDPDTARPAAGKKQTRVDDPDLSVELLQGKTPKPKNKGNSFDLPVDDPIDPKADQEEKLQLPLRPVGKPAEDLAAQEKNEKNPPSGKKNEKPSGGKEGKADLKKAETEIDRQIAVGPVYEQSLYVYPSTDLLEAPSEDAVDASAEMRENTRRLQEKLSCFNVDAQIVDVTRGPNVTMFELQLAQGVRLNKVTGLAEDIALELGATSVRISAIPEKNSMVGVEVPNKEVSIVKIREILESQEFRNAKSKISFAVGKDINGNAIVGDIAKMPHVLIAGTTGSGKSVCTNSVLISILYKATPEEVKLIVIDPKMVEFGIYNGVPHLLIPVVTDAKKAAGALQWAVTEMMRRYRALSDAGVRDIESYNRAAATDESLEPMPKLVVVIDELADLMMVANKEVEEAICRIAQMGRASGVHLVIATQRPSSEVITGLMKANIPSRIALVVSSAMESRIILDAPGADKLIGKGDMLYAPLGKGRKRVQGCYIGEAEVQRVIDFVKSNGTAEYSDEIQQEIDQRAAQSGKNGGGAASAGSGAMDEEGGDELLPDAVEVFLESGMASVSLLQRRLKLGYARAARIVDEMAERGYVGPFEGSKPRTLLVTKEQWEAMKAGQPFPGAEGSSDAGPVEDLIE